MLSKLRELSKLGLIHKFIVSRAVNSVRGDRNSSHLLTELYLDALGDQGKLPRKSLASLFPGIENSVFSIHGKAHPYLTEGFAGREAQTSANETCALAAITAMLQPKRVLEIGTAHGGTTHQFFLNAPNAEIFTLDISAPKLVDQTIRTSFESGRIKVLTADSRDFEFSSLEDVDLIFIDGGHDEETVLADSRNAFDVVGENGVILWHDYKPTFPGVFAALNELSKDREIVHIWGTSLAIYRAHA